MAPRSHGSAQTSGSTVLQGPARPRVQTPRRGGSGPTRPRPAAWTCSVRPVAPSPSSPCGFPGPLVPMCSPTAWPCPQPPDRAQQDSRRHRALALRSGELCDRHTSASAALQRPRPAASAQAPRGRVAAGLLQSRGHPHEHLLHLHSAAHAPSDFPPCRPAPAQLLAPTSDTSAPPPQTCRQLRGDAPCLHDPNPAPLQDPGAWPLGKGLIVCLCF